MSFPYVFNAIGSLRNHLLARLTTAGSSITIDHSDLMTTIEKPKTTIQIPPLQEGKATVNHPQNTRNPSPKVQSLSTTPAKSTTTENPFAKTDTLPERNAKFIPIESVNKPSLVESNSSAKHETTARTSIYIPTSHKRKAGSEVLQKAQGADSRRSKKPRTSIQGSASPNTPGEEQTTEEKEPSGLVFGATYQELSSWTMQCILRAARASQILPNGLFTQLADAQSVKVAADVMIEEARTFAVQEMMDLFSNKLDLWQDLGELERLASPFENEDLTRFAKYLTKVSQQDALFVENMLIEYLRMSFVDERCRVPFYYSWFEKMWPLKIISDGRPKDEYGYPLQLDPFKVFGRTYAQSSQEGLRLIYEALDPFHSRSRKIYQKMPKSELWLNILHTFRACEQRQQGVAVWDRRMLSDMIYTTKDLDVDDFSEMIAIWVQVWRNDSGEIDDYDHFYFEEFLRCNNLEDKDPNVGEFGVLIERSLEVPKSYYETYIECKSCLETLPRDKFLLSADASTCKHRHHEPRTCLGCLHECLLAQINDEHVLCPDCSEPVDYKDIKQWCTPATFKRYDDALFKRWQANEPTFIECLKCKAGQMHIGEGRLMICASCKYLMCTRHMIDWHFGESCEEYDARNTQRVVNERLSKAFIETETKKCPKCRIPVEKNGGCNHFTCSGRGGCGYQFCWLCMQNWSGHQYCGAG